MYKPLKYLLLSSAILVSCQSIASTTPVFIITPSKAAVVMTPGSSTTLGFTVSNNMNVPLKVTNVKPLSNMSNLQASIPSDTDTCTGTVLDKARLGLTITGGNSCDVTATITAANVTTKSEGYFDITACIDGGAYCSASRVKAKFTIDPNPQLPPLIAGGSYVDKTTNTKTPLLAISSDAGANWSYKIDSRTLPTDYDNSGYISSVNCAGSNCLAGGSYRTAVRSTPLLAMSSDSGASWSYKIDGTKGLPLDYKNYGKFNSVNCSGLNCIAGGRYGDISYQYPLLATSSDGGASWSYKIEKGKPLPSDFKTGGNFNSVNCDGLNCIAGGRYDENTDSYNIPLLATSHDGGASWSYTIEEDKPLPADFKYSGDFNSVNCSGLNCIAGGWYKDSTTTFHPLLATSSNGGASWVYKIEKGNTLPSDFKSQGYIHSVNCAGLNCIAGGSYADTSANSYPLLAISSDGGANWSYKIEKGNTLPLDYNNSGFINSVNCAGSNCFAAGQYKAVGDTTFSPLLATSPDGGASWSYKIDSTSTKPNDYKNSGIFNSVNSVTNSYLPDSLSFISQPLRFSSRER